MASDCPGLGLSGDHISTASFLTDEVLETYSFIYSPSIASSETSIAS